MAAPRSCSSRSSTAGSAGTRSSAAERSSCRSRRPSRGPSRSSATSRYDHAATLEPTRATAPAGPDAPESRFVVADTLVRFDHAHGFAEVLWGDPDVTTAAARRAEAGAAVADGEGQGHTRRHPSRLDYEKGVRRAIEHIRAGDAFQIVLSQRAERPTAAGAIAIYRTLRRINPSPYTFLLDLDGIALIGSLHGRRS